MRKNFDNDWNNVIFLSLKEITSTILIEVFSKKWKKITSNTISIYSSSSLRIIRSSMRYFRSFNGYFQLKWSISDIGQLQ